MPINRVLELPDLVAQGFEEQVAYVQRLVDLYNRDTASQINRIKLFFKLPTQTEEVIEELNLRMYFPQELDSLLVYNGFIIEDKFGDYEESPFVSSEKLRLVAL